MISSAIRIAYRASLVFDSNMFSYMEGDECIVMSEGVWLNLGPEKTTIIEPRFVSGIQTISMPLIVTKTLEFITIDFEVSNEDK